MQLGLAIDLLPNAESDSFMFCRQRGINLACIYLQRESFASTTQLSDEALLDHLGWLFWVTLGWSGSVEGVPGVEKSGVHFPGSKTVPFPGSVIGVMTESWIRSNFQAL